VPKLGNNLPPPAPGANLPEPAQFADLADLKRKSVRGGLITFVTQGINIVIQLASTVILARLLSPNDYGVMAMVVAVTVFAGLFRDLGLSAAAIQKHTLTRAQQSNLFWMNIALGGTLTLALAWASPLVAWFYHRPEVLWVTVALSANFLIGSLATQSGALLVREMRFGRQAAVSISGAVVGLVISVTLAIENFRFWSLVWGQLAGSLTTSILLFSLSPFRPGLPSRGTGLKEMLKFGAHLTAFDFVNYFSRNLDNILIGRFWGAEALGYYSRAYSLLMFPIINLRGPITAVAFPALSRLQNQPEAFRTYYCRVTSVLALISMPLTTFFFVASKPVIELLLGHQWLPIAPIFSCLAFAAFIQPAAGLTGSLLLSLGQGRRYLQCGIFSAIFVCSGFAIGLPWGPSGVALGYTITTYLILYPSLYWAFRASPVSVYDFVEACAFPALISFVAGVLVVILRSDVTEFSLIAQLGLFSVIFLIVIVSAVCLTTSGRKHLDFLLGLAGHFKKV
jgi:PST family polysaccharide transporter